MGPISSETASKEEDEYGSRKPRFINRVQRHLSSALALAGDHAELKEAIVRAITEAFGDITLNLTVNSNLDGIAIHSNQKKYQVKQVSLMV